MSIGQAARPVFQIHLANQVVFSLAELPDHVPRRRGGKRLNVATGYRWAQAGTRAKDGSLVRLPTIQVAGTKCTSVEAFQWFCERLSAGSGGPTAPAIVRTKAAEQTDRELTRLGL